MEVGYEEGDIIPLQKSSDRSISVCGSDWTYSDRLSSENDEILGSHHHEASKFVTQDAFDVVLLLDLDAHASRIHGRLDEDLLLLIAGDNKWVEENFARCTAGCGIQG
jgi:hypothetical protein